MVRRCHLSGANQGPITDELICLKQAFDLLKVAEDLVQPENIERFPRAIASGHQVGSNSR